MSEFKMLICTIDDKPCTTKKPCKDCEKYQLAKAINAFLTADKE